MPLHLKHIVIADDDEDDIAMFTSAVVESFPTIDVIVAKDGVKLLSILNKIPKVDAILLDLNMPIKSGKECLDEIRSKKEFDKVPITILSTSNSRREMDYCLSNGADNYFVKPHSLAALRSIVTNICNGVLTQIN